MITFTLQQAANAINAIAIGPDVSFDSVTTDSRADVSGKLFIALRGERFDGHVFVHDALYRGAAAVMVAADDMTPRLDHASYIVVDDTHQGLIRLATAHRQNWSGQLIAVTGSNGKTTVKEMIACILNAWTQGQSLATHGNFNNTIGVPLTLLRLKPQHPMAVIEMGMNHTGEMTLLTHMAQPTIALINNAQREHMAYFSSVAEVAAANAEVFASVATQGTIVLPKGDVFYDHWAAQAHAHFNKASNKQHSHEAFNNAENTLDHVSENNQIVSFGWDTDATISGTWIQGPREMTLHITMPTGDFETTLIALGEHNALNALAATACAYAAGISITAIREGLTQFRSVQGRLQPKEGINGLQLIDDSYNANPDSVHAAIRVLAQHAGHRILILGDMGEVGEQGPAFHHEIGLAADHAGIDHVYTIGIISAETSRILGSRGQHFETPEALIEYTKTHCSPHTTVLVKGSRFMRMEYIVAALSLHTLDKDLH